VSKTEVGDKSNIFINTQREKPQSFIKIDECGNLWESDKFGTNLKKTRVV